jgi:hypothetical protein
MGERLRRVLGAWCLVLGKKRQKSRNTKRIDDCRLMIVDLRIELENEQWRQASSLQKSKFNNQQSEINPDFCVWAFLRQNPTVWS